MSIQLLCGHSSPTRFDDPYDCTITVAIDDPTDDGLQSHFFFDVDLPETAREELNTTSQGTLPRNLERFAKTKVENAVEQFLNKNGV